MERNQNRESLPSREIPQQTEKFYLVAKVEKRRRLVEQNEPRLLRERPGEQHALALAVTQLRKGALSEFFGAHIGHGARHRRMILLPQGSEAPRVGIAPCLDHLARRCKLRLSPLGK